MRKNLDQLLADVRARRDAEERELARRYRAARPRNFHDPRRERQLTALIDPEFEKLFG